MVPGLRQSWLPVVTKIVGRIVAVGDFEFGGSRLVDDAIVYLLTARYKQSIVFRSNVVAVW